MGTSDSRVLEVEFPWFIFCFYNRLRFKKMARSVGKLIIGENICTGFFLDLSNNGKVFNCVISNQHVIEDKDIEEKKD